MGRGCTLYRCLAAIASSRKPLIAAGDMEEEIGYLEDELKEIQDEIRKEIDACEKLEGLAREDAIVRIEDRISRSREMFRGYKVELRTLPREVQRDFQDKSDGHAQGLKNLSNRLLMLKTGDQRDELLAGGGGGDVQMTAAGALINKAKAVQEESHSSLLRSKKLVQDR